MRLRATRWFAALSPRRRLLTGASLLIVAGLVAVGALRAAQGSDATVPAGPGTSQPGAAQSAAGQSGAGQSGAGRSGVSPPGAGQPTTVILVPGYGGNTGSLGTLAARVRAKGDTALIVALPSGGPATWKHRPTR